MPRSLNTPSTNTVSRRSVIKGGTALTAAAAAGPLLTGVPAASAATETSPNGWPAGTTPSSIGVGKYPIRGTSVQLMLKSGDVSTVLGEVAARFNASVETLGTGCWGWAYRQNANNSNVLSNHSSGTAMDLNASKHQNGKSGTFSSAQVAQIRTILDLCEGVVRWGGDYTSTKDEMHFEINVAPGDARLARVAAKFVAPQVAPQRIAVLDSSNRSLQVKEGGLTAAWTQEISSGVSGFALDGWRIGVVDADGTARVKQGTLTDGWLVVADNAADIAMWGNRIAVLRRDGSVIVKDGDLKASWVTLISSGASKVALASDRVAVLQGGVARVKQGDLYATIVDVASGVTDLAVEEGRLAVVQSGSALVKEGRDLSAGWTKVADATRVELSGDRIGIVTSTNDAFVKEGLTGAWITMMTTGVTDLSLTGNRVGLVQSGVAWVKEGALNAGWTKEYNGAAAIVVSD